jgi:glycosyltransferase involved in cell wall biosynthesis
MRILIASSHRNLVGGVEKYLQAILPPLALRGHELALLYEYRFDPGMERIDPPEIEIPSIGIHEAGEEAGLRFLREWKPDVVYSQGLEATRVQSALLSEYPTVFYAHNYVGTCASGEKCHAFPNPQPCDRRFGPACLVLYYPRRCGGLHPGTALKMYRRAAERNAQLPRFAAVLVASAHMRREYERHGVPLAKIHLSPLPNPHEGEVFDAAPRTPSRVNLLFLGRLTKLKGAAQMLRAIPLAEKQLGTRLSIVVAGDGPELAGLQKFALGNSMRAEFTGWIRSAQKDALIAQSDLLVVPSLWPEPFGLVGIEAGAHGVPAVAYDVGGISDWLIPGYSGELAPGYPPTVEGLADAMVRALSDPLHYASLSRGAREVAGRFTLAAHLSKLESTFETIFGTAARAGHPDGEEAIHADA